MVVYKVARFGVLSRDLGKIQGCWDFSRVFFSGKKSEKKLQELLETVRRESEKGGLTINVTKTECMVIKKEK